MNSNAYGDWTTPAPIFLQRSLYKTKLSVFEKYVNVDNGGAIDNVPVIDGLVRIQNGLAIDNKIREYELNDKGELDYEFKGGLPNIADNGTESYKKSMTVKVFTGRNNSITTDWPADGMGFKGYLLGGMPTGSNFVTSGPNVVSMIIRDPQGSNSYAYYETGTTTSTEYSFDVEHGGTVGLNATLLLGAKTITFAGLGAGVIVEAQVVSEASLGVETTTNFIDNNTAISSVTNTKTWSTSAEPDFVGANGDMFIGNSTNIVYGKNIFVDLLPSIQCDGDANCVGSNPDYKIGISEGVRISPEFFHRVSIFTKSY